MSAAATTEIDARDLKISEQVNVIVELTKVIEQLQEQNNATRRESQATRSIARSPTRCQVFEEARLPGELQPRTQ